MGRRCRILMLLLVTVITTCLLIAMEVNEVIVEDQDTARHAEKKPPSTVPSVRFIVAQSLPCHGWCRMLASAILSNVSVEILGYGRKYTHVKRVIRVIRYIEKEKLRDSDVVVVYDGSDTLISGASTVQRAVDRFIATTAPTPDAFDAAAVRRGVATAPVLFTGETTCYHPQLGMVLKLRLPTDDEDCLTLYHRAWKVMGYKDSSVNPSEPGKSRFRFLNAGGYVARVWALKRALAVYSRVLTFRRSRRQIWRCDQSVWGLVYLWSITQDPRMTPDVRIPRGLINLDFHNTFFVTAYGTLWGRDFVPWSSTAIADVAAGGRLPFPLFFHMADKPNATPAILHFNSRGEGTTKSTLWMLRNHTSWYVETMRSAAAFLKARDMLRHSAFVEIDVSGTGKVRLPYGRVCPIDVVESLIWLPPP
ncbi:hypothetical protein LSM04_001524 [Trypanosoma melophagium]|uniref:uncharacterized protein n=1 Tax=Trypanosoma melophagium TaxID=715481 RepID=UPI00351A4DB5|nr:hypothetical protein LSM04_001524 [Trypanosoma melophagium]